MSTQLFLDFESMGVGENAVLLAMAIVAYSEKDVDVPLEDLIKKNGVFWKFDAREQITMGRSTDKDTMDWWKKQGEDAISMIVKPDLAKDQSITLLPDLIDDYCAKQGYDGKGFVWQRGNIDILWHDSIMAHLGVDVPDRAIKWWKIRDIRTAIDLLSTASYKSGGIMRESGMEEKFNEQCPGFIAHHPSWDVAKDIFQMREVGIL